MSEREVEPRDKCFICEKNRQYMTIIKEVDSEFYNILWNIYGHMGEFFMNEEKLKSRYICNECILKVVNRVN